jgi:hypothetical protein
MRRIVLALFVLALVTAGSATAGGWATVRVNLPPAELAAGEAWNARVLVLRHGQTPTGGAKPSVIVANTATGKTIRYAARPTAKLGVYRARVVFPEAGVWRYQVDDGLAASGVGVSRRHPFPALLIRAAAA